MSEGNINRIFSIKDLVTEKNMETVASAIGATPEFVIENLEMLPPVKPFYGDRSILASVSHRYVHKGIRCRFDSLGACATVSGDLELINDENGNSFGTQENESFMGLLARIKSLNGSAVLNEMIESVTDVYANWANPIINGRYRLGQELILKINFMG